ncbi:MAG: SDR family NAD(P)-dependent oxidoreductase [Gammaproteobacteria bacterium]|nr:SDR family NAD(P)-dependent oxidoreductase [Gammaproteobacteria bacterium]
MTQKISRRGFVAGASSVAVAGGLTACAEPGSEDFVPVPGLERGPFGADSTAEDVTAGLDLTGMTALVTGANSGLGLETMRVLAVRGAHVIGTGRTLEKAETACSSISGETTPAVLELTELDSIASCAEQVNGMDRPIDMLILNAGIMALPELEQVNGLEKQFAVNHMGHYLLGRLLLDRVVAAPAGRIVVLSSSGHMWAPDGGIEFDNLSGEVGYDPMKAYGQSKLANGLFAFELARRLEDTNATANAVHPGIINTNLGRYYSGWIRAFANMFGWIFMKNVEQGAATQTYVATRPELVGLSGYYFADCNPIVPDPRMNDEKLAAELWDVSEEFCRSYLT